MTMFLPLQFQTCEGAILFFQIFWIAFPVLEITVKNSCWTGMVDWQWGPKSVDLLKRGATCVRKNCVQIYLSDNLQFATSTKIKVKFSSTERLQ